MFKTTWDKQQGKMFKTTWDKQQGKCLKIPINNSVNF